MVAPGRAEIIGSPVDSPINRSVDDPSTPFCLAWGTVFPESALPRVLRWLRVGLHVLFAVLLAVAVLTAEPSVILFAGAGVLAAVYLVGTLAEHRGAAYRRPIAASWLTLVLVLWALLVVHAPTFVWLLFPLVFVILHVLGSGGAGLLVVLAAWAWAVGAPTAAGTQLWGIGGVIGPAIGTVAAVAIYLVYQALRREADRYRAIAETLAATQESLASSERQAGRLAERERLARDIHDTLAQGLSSIVLISRATRKSLATGDTDAAERQLSAIEQAASDNLAEARQFVAGLHSPVLVDSLPDALREVGARARREVAALGHGPSITVTTGGEGGDPDAEPVDETTAGVAIRVTQEAITNALKHADASQIVVTYGSWPGEITIDVVDDGRGFDDTDPTDGYGLSGLRTRVEKLGGQLSVESTPGSGTAVAARLPRRNP